MKKIYGVLLLNFCIATAYAQVSGCTDPLSLNFNAVATVNDGSCTYAPVSIVPVSTLSLPSAVKETSGLIKIGSSLYTHNDDNDTNLYKVNDATGAIEQTISIPGVTNVDWEEITQDDDYIYIGDFGNNSNGNRTDLKIIKISRLSLTNGTIEPEIISFTYSNQNSLAPTGSNNTDFDCEAMIVVHDDIYLFTKQWVSGGTTIYKLPKTPGSHVAAMQGSFNVNGLITGATFNEENEILTLIGYSTMVQPFVYIFYDFEGQQFFSGNKRKLQLSLPFHQTESITSSDGLSFFVTNESFVQLPFVNNLQMLHRFDLTAYLGDYINAEVLTFTIPSSKEVVRIYPNPANNILHVDGLQGKTFYITDSNGRTVLSGALHSGKSQVDVSLLANGIYVFRVKDSSTIFKIVKK